MKNRVVKNIILALLILILLMDIHCFYLFPFPEPFSLLFKRYTSVGTGLLSFAAWLLCIRDNTNKYIDLFCYLIIFVFISLSLKSYFSVNHSIKQVFASSSDILCFLCVKPFFVLFKDKNKFKLLMYIFAIIGFVWHSIIILQDFLYVNYSKIILHQFFESNMAITTRAGIKHLRIGSGYLIPLLFEIYNVFDFLFNKNKLKRIPALALNVLMLVVGLYATFFIGQTRSTFLSLGISSVSLILFYGKTKKQFAICSGIIILGIVGLFASGVIQDFLESFALDDTNIYYVNSNTNRLIEYYECINIFLRNPLFGRGLYYGNTYREMYWSSLMGDTLWVNDVGIFGVLASSGIVGITFYFVPVLRIIYLLANNKKKNIRKYYSFFLALFVYNTLTWISSIELGRLGGINAAIIFASLEYMNYKYGPFVSYKKILSFRIPDNSFI